MVLAALRCGGVGQGKDAVIVAVEHDGDDLEHAHASLQRDRDVVLVAVREGPAKDGAFMNALAGLWNWSLKWSQGCRKERNFVVAIAGRNWRVLEHAGQVQRADKQLVLAAVRQDGLAIQYAAASLQADPDIRAAAAAQLLAPVGMAAAAGSPRAGRRGP